MELCILNLKAVDLIKLVNLIQNLYVKVIVAQMIKILVKWCEFKL